MKLVLTMGIPKKNVNKYKEGFRFNRAIIQELDWDSKNVINEVYYFPPLDNIGRGLSIQFKGGSIYKNNLYIVTNTEVLIYNLLTWELKRVFSYPSFNDLHAVLYKNGKIYVCNTGLEMVQVLNEEGEIIEEINMASVATWKRFKKHIDYRTIPTTKPHEVHINHLFEIDGEIWVTRGQKGDAVKLYDQNIRFQVVNHNKDEIILCHDGKVKGDFIYFTSVDGYLIIINKYSKKVEEYINLNKINPFQKRIPWTRGVEVVGRYAFVGATKMRPTKFKELAKWAIKGEPIQMPSCILQVDLEKKEIVEIYEMQKYKNAAIYSILAFKVN